MGYEARKFESSMPQSPKSSRGTNVPRPQGLEAQSLKGLATRMINPASVCGDGEQAWVAVQREMNQEMS